MSTPTDRPQGAMFAQVSALAWHVVTTTPGLVAITFGSGLAALGRPWIGLALAAVGAMVYHEQCGRTPYVDCHRCHGIGHRQGPARGRFLGLGKPEPRRCHHCHGHGVRIRWGRAVMNAYRRATHTRATTAPAALPAPAAGPPRYGDAIRATTDLGPDRRADGRFGRRP